MAKVFILVTFLLYLVFIAASVPDEIVRIQLIPFAPTRELSMGPAVLLFAGLGILTAVLAGLGEWLSLRGENSKLEREMDAMRGELEALRSMMINERESE